MRSNALFYCIFARFCFSLDFTQFYPYTFLEWYRVWYEWPTSKQPISVVFVTAMKFLILQNAAVFIVWRFSLLIPSKIGATINGMKMVQQRFAHIVELSQ